MARFYPLYVRRSDGKLEVISKSKRKETNQPSDEQLDSKPDRDGVSDYYREVKPDEVKHLDWRRKLGGMLARELDWKDKSGQDNGYILVTFPENYRLYEHVKKTEKDGKLEVKNKTHAAGGNDRQDAYLYGHPSGKRKRFRSPNDFFPHLLWLCTDESGDPDNCSCKICSPDDLETLMPHMKIKAERPVKQEPGPKPSPYQQAVSVQRPPSLATTKINPEPSQPVARAELPASRQLVPTPLPQPRSPDQLIDTKYNTFMYRTGELVWFKRGQAWGLGTILRRWYDTQNNYYYTIHPLSYPFHHTLAIVNASDAVMRPWLAWSVPKFTNDGLNNLADPPRFENADWQGMMQRRYGTGDMEVDGSILAAKCVDATYTPVSQIKTEQQESGVVDTYFNGIFLGAEKIWVADPIRLVSSTGTDVMVVHSIVERKKISVVKQRQITQQACSLVGDIYTLSSVSHSNPQQPTLAAPNNNPRLPQRLTQDLAYRNARSISMKQTASYWNLKQAQQRIDLNEIKGRWYEASLILPILQPQQFEESARKGEIQESSLWMNSRGDCLNSNRPPSLPRLPRENTRKETRREAFGRALPDTVRIEDGIQSPPDNVDPSLDAAGASTDTAIQIDPRFDTADTPDGQDGNAGLDEFMNLDGIDDHSQIPFGADYGSQGQGAGFF